MPTGFSESRRCPGEKYAVSEAVCCARTARHFPKCRECKWRDQPGGPQAPQDPPVDLGAIFKAYDVRGTAGTQIHDTLAWKIGYATAQHLLPLAGGGSEKVSGTLSRRVPDTFFDPPPTRVSRCWAVAYPIFHASVSWICVPAVPRTS